MKNAIMALAASAILLFATACSDSAGVGAGANESGASASSTTNPNANEIAGIVEGDTTVSNSRTQLSFDGCHYDQGQLFVELTFSHNSSDSSSSSHDENAAGNYSIIAYQNDVRVSMNEGLGNDTSSHQGFYSLVRPGGSVSFMLSWPVYSFDDPFVLVLSTNGTSSDSSELTITPSQPIP